MEDHFIAKHTITPSEVPNLLVPVKVDYIGRNGMDVFVQQVDMTSNQSHITNEISAFYLLKNTYKRNNLPCQDFLLSQEPSRTFKKQHDIWQQLKNSGEFNYVDLSEAETIINYAEQNDVKPVFGDIDNTKSSDDEPF